MPRTFPAPAKLNLFLHVTGRRADGYHLIESVFQLLDFGDQIEIEVRHDGRVRRTTDLPGVDEASDLVVRAARLLQQATGSTLGADVRVDKYIPMGGGLGGGSSDAATVLLVLNRLWNTGLDRRQLMSLGLRLGADVPFFLYGRNAFASGVGEVLEPVLLPDRWFVVLKPQAHVATVDIFRAPELTRNAKSVKMLDFSPASSQVVSGGAKEEVAGSGWFPEPVFRNDLQPVAATKHSAVGDALAWLKQSAADASISARMSGSGACVFAAFETKQAAEAVQNQCPASMPGFVARGLSCHPLGDFVQD